ncbi:MAG: carboxymuconolactone decarboxylase family protein [Gammaproteobacteria bacterium]
MNYSQISRDTMDNLYKTYQSLKDSPLEASIRVLVELRVSQINGCAYCCVLHANEARKAGVSQVKLDVLSGWSNSDVFTEKEQAALLWCEAVTYLENDTTEVKELLSNHFSEREIVDLTAAASIMNALNRMAISLKD